MPDAPTLEHDTVNEKGARIVEEAKAVAKAAVNTKYTTGGKTLAGFDCSGFVYYVLHHVFPSYHYLTADGIATSKLFIEVSNAMPGDIIYFPKGPNPYEVQRGDTREYPSHVGIVVDDNWWIGRETSHLGLVRRNNVWWHARAGVKYFRFVGVARANTTYLQHLSGFHG